MTYHTRNPRRVRDHIPRPQRPPDLLAAVPGPPPQDAYELAAAAREFALSKQFALAKACIERLRAMAQRPPLKDTRREGRHERQAPPGACAALTAQNLHPGTSGDCNDCKD